MKTHRNLRRPILAALALATLGAPALSSGCNGGFEPVSKIEGLRILAVAPDKVDPDDPDQRVGASYASPGDDVTFTMTIADAKGNDDAIQIVWIAGCFDPDGDQYYGCYPQLAEVLKDIGSGPPPPGLVGIGPKFTVHLPADLISRRPLPPDGPHYGVAYVFFAACAGTLGPVPPDSTGRAGAFPLGCFDADGNRLGADRFVPGYTQIYAFEDGRGNDNPRAPAMTIDGKALPDDSSFEVERCPLTDDERRPSGGCAAKDPYEECTSYEIDVKVAAGVAEVDLDSTDLQGKHLKEVVWVDYFADGGTVSADVKLVSDATTGLTDGHQTKWIPPSEEGPTTLWAVVHDARGGATVLQRTLIVK